MDIKIGKIGRITTGDNQGWYVLVQDDSESTGGFLILQSDDINMQIGQGFDDWVANKADLEQFFAESGWSINWLD